MMRISEKTHGDAIVLAMEGDLVGAWADEFARLLDHMGDAISELELDLASVSYVDASGERILRRAIARGARVRASSGFIAALLDHSVSEEGTP
jgi:hypothetical protein